MRSPLIAALLLIKGEVLAAVLVVATGAALLGLVLCVMGQFWIGFVLMLAAIVGGLQFKDDFDAPQAPTSHTSTGEAA